MRGFLIATGFLLVATILESSGDAAIRVGLFERTGVARIATMAGGALLVFGYGVVLNLTPLPFERVVGLYIATLFLVWQAVSFFTFRAVPNLPVIVGGGLIVIGGLLVTFWTTQAST